MVVVTFLWSIAGVVARQLESAHGFELTFWRSSFNAMFLAFSLGLVARRPLRREIVQGGQMLWVSGAMWAVMYTCFMVALTLTTVANVLITMSIAPLLTALLARMVFGQHIRTTTWCAIAAAGVGIGWMFVHDVANDARHLLGTAVASGVPLAAAVNWLVIQHAARSHQRQRPDLLPAIFLGAVLSALVTLPLAWPLQASASDLGWLSLLGVVQLAIPCMLVVRVAHVLPAHEVALLALLEVVFGVAWAWWGANETPSHAVLTGGAIVMTALVINSWAERRAVLTAVSR
ncbi:MAG TPA: DMT family transporter [Burkholderiaceae bacterium]|nr:DMT family transporter [Burkholderiaceae bacterium]